MQKILLSIFIIVAYSTVNGQHTFSICAVDPLTGEVGSAGASCIPNSDIISDVHPGVGVIHTQSYYVPGNQNYASDLMNDGVAPSAIIDSLVANDVGDDPSIRQYGVVDLIDGGRSASYTGDACLDWKGHLNDSTYAIQGNILLGPEILDGMEAGFLNTEGNLACKLMGALQGAKVPGADTRCLIWGISAESAFIRVAQPTDNPDELWLDLEVRDVNGIANNPSPDPIDSLQQLFDAIGGCDYTGIDHAENNFELLVYPQPTTDLIIFNMSGAGETLTIFNLNGNQVYRSSITGEQTVAVDCQNWVSGIYFYCLTTKNGEERTGKIIIE